jgi:tellurite resistance-related uncharacterized protein
MPGTLPDGLIRSGGTPEFTQDTIPAGLRAAHALARGRWGLLQVLAGDLVFVDETTGVEEQISAPDTRAIAPEMQHHVRVSGPVVCRIDFYRAAVEE